MLKHISAPSRGNSLAVVSGLACPCDLDYRGFRLLLYPSLEGGLPMLGRSPGRGQTKWFPFHPAQHVVLQLTCAFLVDAPTPPCLVWESLK